MIIEFDENDSYSSLDMAEDGAGDDDENGWFEHPSLTAGERNSLFSIIQHSTRF